MLVTGFAALTAAALLVLGRLSAYVAPRPDVVVMRPARCFRPVTLRWRPEYRMGWPPAAPLVLPEGADQPAEAGKRVGPVG